MNQFVRLCLSIVIPSVFLTSCFFGGFTGNRRGSLIIGSSKAGSNNNTVNRSNLLEGSCGENADCIDICEETYEYFDEEEEENEGRIERCLELPYRVVDTFEDIVEALEDPAYSLLQNLDGRNFGDFLNVSLKPWIELINEMRREDSEIVLRWIASEKRVADGIESAYLNYEDFEIYDGVFSMLMDLAPDLSGDPNYPETTDEERTRKVCAEFCRAVFDSNTGGGKSFREIADEVRNTTAQNITLYLVRDICREDGIIENICQPHL